MAQPMPSECSVCSLRSGALRDVNNLVVIRKWSRYNFILILMVGLGLP